MEPLKITFEVSGGFVPPPYPLHLDALIAYAVTQAGLDPSNPELPTDIVSLRAMSSDLPFEKYEQDGEWVWKASALMAEGRINHTSRFFTQRMDKAEYADLVGSGVVQMGRYQPDKGLPPGADMKPYQNSIDSARGPFRNMLDFYPLTEVESLVAWCVGDRDAIEDWLVHSGHVSHLGARRRAGHGFVKSVKIESCPEAADMWNVRVRPWQMREDDEKIQAAWKPPYWAAENKGKAYCPTILS